MNNQNNIQDELNGLNSNLPPNNRQNLFAVPEGYFEGLSFSIMAKIKGNEALSAFEEINTLSPLLASISRIMPNALPVNYFVDTIEELPVFIREEESVVLSFIEKEMPFEVPSGYFTNLPEEILNRVADKKAKVISITKTRWMRMAVAAVVAGIISLSGYFYFNNHNNPNTLASVPVAQQLKNVSTKALEEFITTTDVTAASTETVQNKPASKLVVKTMLNDVSDKELDTFLAQVPIDDEDLTAIN